MTYIPTIYNEIPTPRVQEYSASMVNPIQATEMNTGRVRTREKWRNVPQIYSVNYRLSDAQFSAFEGFIKHECNNGALDFRLRLRLPRSTQLDYYRVKMLGPYEWSWVEASDIRRGYWDVRLSVMTAEDTRSTISEYIDIALGMPLHEAQAMLAEGINSYWLGSAS
ncbi:hypothetical protein HOP61_19675 [Halomonas daqingensis]|uniref:Uncharacterized protein n=1 Tax=Billgrantia desiderata TaxID=52021 RepID=A0AAW4YZ30_9GAMM|nr:hypothetical protein [Halomonas desiderata]MCE8053517.1 hypothetical protein [Halomonas desiderata]